MFGKEKVFLLILLFIIVPKLCLFGISVSEGSESSLITSSYCVLENNNNVLGGVYTEFFREGESLESTGCVPFIEPIEDYIDLGETVYSLAGKGSVLAVGFYNRVEVYSIMDYDEKELLFSKNVYGPVYDLAIEGDILYLAVENGVSKINLETEDYFHKHTYGTTKALRIHNDKLYVGDGQGVKKMNLDTLDIEDQRNTSGDVTKLEIMDGVIYTFEWAGLKRFNLSTLAPISTWGWNPYNPELRAYDGTLYAFGNNSVQKVTFNGSSVVRTAMTGDRVELRNNHTYDEFTFFPDGNGIRVSYLERQFYKPDYDVSEFMTVLGNEKINPYSVSIMMAARNNLVSEGILQPGEVTDEDLAPTHYYVVFEPQNSEEMNILREYDNILISDYPLHYEVVYSGIYYRDPDVPENQPTYQYAVVEVGQELPDIQYFILNHLILEPEDEEDLTTFFYVYFPMLEYEAYQIAGVYFDKLPVYSGWNPSGMVTVYDTSKGHNVPVSGKGVFIRETNSGRTWLITTGDNGVFHGSTTRSPHIEYSIQWNIGNIIGIHPGEEKNLARFGPFKKTFENWMINIEDDGVPENRNQWLYAHTYRAARNYLDLGYDRGIMDANFKKLSIGVFDRPHPDGYDGYYLYTESIPIKLFFGGRTSTRRMFLTTTHEIAHAHHHFFTTRSWRKMSRRIAEAWAILIEHVFANEVYSGVGFWQNWSLNDFYCRHKNINYSEKYSAIGVDLYEHPQHNLPYTEFNQSERYASMDDTYPVDRVGGYPLFVIQDSIRNIRKFKHWEGKLKSIYPENVTEIYLGELFDQYKKKENVNWKNPRLDPGC